MPILIYFYFFLRGLVRPPGLVYFFDAISGLIKYHFWLISYIAFFISYSNVLMRYNF